jgi:hypothetical protein
MNHEKADITVRLRHATHPASATAPLVMEAVDEIAKLRAMLAEAVEFAEQDFHALTPAGEAMLDRWRAAL